jgi:TonB-dependent receptor
MMRGKTISRALVRTTSLAALAAGLALPGAAMAQVAASTQTVPSPADPQQGTPQADTTPGPVQAEAGSAASNSDPDAASEDIVVTGVRASLERSIAIKRESFGVVDAISAEDIGKFANTNLAESLQRITGVSIDRVNGEGSTVTVRGFGAQYNLVTLNGRQLATSNIVAVGGDQGGDGAGGSGRSFDFANLASEGVRTLEVYKTGRAAVPSGGIGATINIVGTRPLDRSTTGLSGSVGVKGVYDNSVDHCIECGDKVTPEASGLVSWSDGEQRFGVSLFGSYQKRNFSTPSVAQDGWNIRTLTDFLNPANGFVRDTTTINNAPTDGSTLVAVPNDHRYHFSELSRERINGQGVVQFKPTDGLTLTADALFAQLRSSERRSSQSNWFNRPFDEVTFDDASDGIATTEYLHETIGGVKDAAFEQAYRAQKNRLTDFGLNGKWQATDRLTLALDGHIGKAESLPDNPNGRTSTTVAFNAPVVAAHSLSWSRKGFPSQTLTINDGFVSTLPTSSANPDGTATFIKGNNNGVLDVGDLSSAIQREFESTQTQKVKEARFDAGWDFGGGSRFDFGGNFRTTTTEQTQINTRQVLGDWGNALPPDIERLAPGQVQTYCAVCKFTKFNPDVDANSRIAFRTQDATKLYNTLASYYSGLPLDPNQTAFAGKSVDGINHANNLDSNTYNRVKEDIWSVYGQITWKGEIGGRPASLVTGARFESTRVRALSLQPIPQAIVWQADNDFNVLNSADRQPVTDRGSYTNLLPSMDFQVELMTNLIGRFSASRTISRPGYGSLYASTGVGGPPRPTVIGGVATGNANDTDLDPLTSDNFDLSLEWYPNKDTFLSIGFFDKRVSNFIGNTQVNRNLFGLRDPTSGAAGSRSGTARTQLNSFGADLSDVNLFTYTALLAQNGGNVAAADATFLQNYNAGTRSLNQGFVDSTLAAVDILADANDPLFNFSVNTPINNKSAEIYGLEVAGQYFFGDTGIGVAGSYTLVRGNIGIDVRADPSVDLFALIGLSDTANATLIYDKYGISARLSYNWRDKFLSGINRDSFRNPTFTAPYSQVDVNISYDITPNIAVSFEGINLFEEGVRQYGRDQMNSWFITEGSARYLLGARYRF